ncbi:MAG TPA: ABC transporter substrate-binding protein [Pseudacidobacterium sp.]|jgi:iron complex transport system substrate-binding protein|nr:ABC transporter substrate-binding protein [Pseudacidobacterium sp.]
MRIVSLQPSVSVILEQLGRLDMLVACTRYCLDVVPELRRRNLPIVQDSWTTTTDELTRLDPDLVIASVPYRNESLAAILKSGIPILALTPHSLGDIYKDIHLIASITNACEQGQAVISTMCSAILDIQNRAATADNRPLVYCEEWGKPLIHSQFWVRELVEAAGGQFLGTPGKITDAEAIARANPDVIVIAWCGAGDRVPLERTMEKRGWHHLKAASSQRVYCIADELLNTPAPSLIGGAKALASAVHPEIFGEPQSPTVRCINFLAKPSKLV